MHFLPILISLGVREVPQEDNEQIDGHQNDNRPEVINPDEETAKESYKEITSNDIDSMEEKNEENNSQEARDGIESEDDGKFEFLSLISATLLILKF